MSGRSARSEPSETDRHWEARARELDDSERVNIEDVHQRRLELEFVRGHLQSSQRVLEAGCGNGFNASVLAPLVARYDGFDFSPAMIRRASELHGGPDRSFWVGNILDRACVESTYDAIVCIRVLINLRDLDEQRTAAANLLAWLRPGGLLLLVEGFLDGFTEISRIRTAIGLPPVEPAGINFYSYVSELLPVFTEGCELEATWDSGAYDLLTRVALPAVLGPENVPGVTEHHARLAAIAEALPAGSLTRVARLHGYALRLRG